MSNNEKPVEREMTVLERIERIERDILKLNGFDDENITRSTTITEPLPEFDNTTKFGDTHGILILSKKGARQ
jgi:hypothetical protein